MKLFAPYRRKRLSNTDFTIISNNCWGGVCYDHFGLEKLSPTVGCFIMTDDYLRFITNLDYYLLQELKFIPLRESKHYEEWRDDPSMQDVPIGVLEDIEIAFLHYRNPEQAKAKWSRRTQRINRNNLIFKFSYMNNCSIDDINRFVDMTFCQAKKYVLLNEESIAKIDDCLVYYKGFEDCDQIYNDTYYWDRYFNVVTFLNDGIINVR